MDEIEMFEKWVSKVYPASRAFYGQEAHWMRQAWLEAVHRADRKARLECERIALQYSQAYGQIDDAMAIARDIRATIPDDPT